VGSNEKVDDVLRGGSIGAALTVVFTFTFPDGVRDVFVRMRMFSPGIRLLCTVSLPQSRRFKAATLTAMRARYPLPHELARHVAGGTFAPDELREACREAGEGLGRGDAREARFRSAAEMVEMWRGLDLPAWVAPYALRDARLGYLAGYGDALVSGELAEERVREAAQARWGNDWREKLASARERVARG
jgi:pimeloyl-ACP methyl ester carboxylesterase